METLSPSPPSSSTSSSIILLLLLNIFLILLGLGGPLLMRLYFLHGGSRIWFSSFVQTAGFPIFLVPIFLSSSLNNRRPFRYPRRIFIACIILGIFQGLDGYLYGYGSAYLPVSTSTIIFSSQLSFTAVFAFFINRQRFTAYSINSVVLLTLGPVVLALSAGNDKPSGESSKQYLLGFIMCLLAAALLGCLMPATERMFKMVKEGMSYGIVMELQFLVALFASCFSLVGMAAAKDTKAIAREAKEFGLGEVKYIAVIICVAILYQLSALGMYGVISYASSLFSGVTSAALLPVSEILALIFFHEKFNGNKGIALVLSLWGFASYLYGGWKQDKKLKKMNSVPSLPTP